MPLAPGCAGGIAFKHRRLEHTATRGQARSLGNNEFI
jgi:hypothetical protein